MMQRILKAIRAMTLSIPIGAVARCAVCDRPVRGFLPYRDGWVDAPAVLIDMQVIGSDLSNFECPRCGAHDRERHLLLYMKASGLWGRIEAMRVLHAAPERRLSRLIGARNPTRYLMCDLFPRDKGVERVDLQDIQFPDKSFDLVIANHVLEHVSDLPKALNELGRVLAPGGQAILQTPYASKAAHTLEDPSILSGQARLESYGQEDHLRLFGADVLQLLEEGLGARWVGGSHADLLPDVVPALAGVNEREPFMLFRKDE